MAGCAQAQDGYVAQWPGFVVLVWQYQTPPPGPAAKAAYESVNLRGIHLDNGFPDELLQFAIANNYAYYVDHAAGKGDLYLRRDVWDQFAAGYRVDRARPVRPNCFLHGDVQQRMRDLLTENVTRARRGPVVAYAFDDEISVTSFTSPADVCWCDVCLGRFREWLAGQYGTVHALNAEWGTAYGTFAEAEPAQVDDLRDQHALPFDRWNLSPWCDHRAFMDTVWAETLAGLRDHTNALDGRAPAGFVGGQAPAAYGGYDYARLCDAVQWMEAYDIGGTNEILRSFWGQARPHLQTFFTSGDAERDRWFLWYYFVHGNRGVVGWPEGWFAGDEPQEVIRQLAPTLGELQGPLSTLLTSARLRHDRIAVYYSQPSIRVSWFMDIQPHGSTWINRSSSLNNDNATDLLNRWAWAKLLEDCGLQYEFVSYLKVAAQGLSRDRYDLLILPRTLALSDREADAIRAFAAAGGAVVADYLPGVFDEHGKGRLAGALDDLFGVRRDPSAGVLDGQSIAEVNGELYDRPLAERLSYEGALRDGIGVAYERGLAATDGEAAREVGGTAVRVRRPAGAGQAVYLNLTPIEYLLQRTTGGAEWRRLVAGLAEQAGVRPPVAVRVDGQDTPTVECLLWEVGDRTLLCIVANPLRLAGTDAAESGAEVLGGPARRLELAFAKAPRRVANLRTRAELPPGGTVTDQWVPCEANLYEVAW